MGNKITETKARSIHLRVLRLARLGGLAPGVRVYMGEIDVFVRADVAPSRHLARTGGITGR